MQYQRIGNRAAQGFTLIELMIVVVIIGILSSIALPAYTDYTARAQASEALKVSAGLQADIGAYHGLNQAFPPAGDGLLTGAAQLQGKYFGAGNLVVGAGTGQISVTFTSGALAAQTMTITPALAASGAHIARWTCAGLTKVSHLPSGCR